jgi:diaminohydroxyphosphoribosylaminopyrimidine deaminase/5-amino-6-(5-phosphoribosylamino)uracil reductase
MGTAGEKIMQSALKLAAKGIGSVEPNPAVGCIIVKAGQVIGKGWHKKFGGPHAEINALDDCRNLGVKPDGATMYVTLEPCCHQGKTGPCTDAIIEAGLAKVIVAVVDPSPHADGKGIERLRNAGIEVEVGVCEAEAKLLNAPFLKFITTGKPWVVLKWAQSIDGKVAYGASAQTGGSLNACSEQGRGAEGLGDSHRQAALDAATLESINVGEDRQWISNELSRADSHRLRRRVGAIVVGVNTVIADDPMLTPRPGKGKKPIRIVLDRSLRIPLSCRLLRTTKSGPVVVCTSEVAAETNPKIVERITKKGAEVLASPEGQSNLQFLLDEMTKRGVQQVLVEGGPKVLAAFLKEGLADEICVYIAPKILGGAGSVHISDAMAELVSAVGLQHVDIKSFGDDVRISGLTKLGLTNIGVGKD